MPKKIVLIGGPGSGKSSVINALEQKEFYCFHEISREITLKAQQEGIEQLFLEQPILFSEKLLEGREQQFLEADSINSKIVFFDRGIPSIEAYLQYSKTEYPTIFTEKSKQYRYEKVFLFKPWEDIYIADNERYETFEQALKINKYLENIYSDLGYELIKVPFGTIEERCTFILNTI